MDHLDIVMKPENGDKVLVECARTRVRSRSGKILSQLKSRPIPDEGRKIVRLNLAPRSWLVLERNVKEVI